MPTDAELLQRYVRQHDERAFAELVQRHLGLVYATALRSTGGRVQLAEEVTQKVFTVLARKAGSLCQHPVLSGWLYRSARYAAMEANRAEARRQNHQLAFAAMPEVGTPAEPAPDWEQLLPVLDEAMEALKEDDRQLMLLRFFQGLTFPEMGARLKLSENAARMRVERALDRLRGHLGRRGVTSTAAALTLVLANRAVAAPPEGLAGSVAAAALHGAAQAAGVGLWPMFAGSRVATWCLVALCVGGVGATGWRWVAAGAGAPAGAAPDLTHAANEFAANALALYRLMAQVHPPGTDRAAGSAAAPALQADGGGPASLREAILGFAEASRARDVPRLAQWLTFDAQGAEVARAIHARMPAPLRETLRTAEELFAFFYATDTLLSPVPPAAFLQTFQATEIKPGRVAVHRPGSAPSGLEFVLTDEGWKHEVPTHYLTVLSARMLSNETLAKLQALPGGRASVAAGPATPEDGTARAALQAFAAACNRGEVAAVAAGLYFDPAAKAKALAFMDGLPPALRGKWRSPEELAADLLVDAAIGNPYPTESVLALATAEPVGDGRVALLLPDTIRERLEFQPSAGGWKHVVTEAMVDGYLQRMARAAAPQP